MILSPNRILSIERYWTFLLFNLDIEMLMNATDGPDILLEGGDVTSSDIVLKSLLLEGQMLDIRKVNIL